MLWLTVYVYQVLRFVKITALIRVVYTSRCALLHFAAKICNKTNIYGGTTPQNIYLFQTFESLNISKILLGPPFLGGSVLGSWGSCPFFNTLCGLGLNYIRRFDYLSCFLFTVMPKGLTTGPKSMCDRTCLITTKSILYIYTISIKSKYKLVYFYAMKL